MAARVERFGAFTVLGRLAIGSVGEVLRAKHASGKEVALKRLLPQAAQDQAVVTAFRFETDLTGKLDHASIPKLFDRGRIDGVDYAAYELVDGRDLRTLLEATRKAGRRMPHDLAVQIAVRISDALGHVHELKDEAGKSLEIVHRDVSPANIMIGFDGSVNLVDFGIARSASRPKLTAKGEVKGSLRYVSPEQVAEQKVDARSDLFSLGLVLWEMLVGRSALEGTLDAVLRQVGRGDVPSPRSREPTISTELDAIVRKVLAKAPEERYDSASFFSAALTSEARPATASGADGDAASFAARLAQLMSELFPGDVGSARFEESLMADDKGSSDLDVFEGLAKKSQRPSQLSGPLSTRDAPPPPPSAPPPSAGPVSHRAPPPPPPSARPAAAGKTTLLGMPLPASTASALGLPPPAPGAGSNPPPSGRPPAPPASMRSPSSTNPTPPPTPVSGGPTSTPAPLPPPPSRKHSTGATAPVPPPGAGPSSSNLPPPPPPSKVAPPVALPPPPPKDPPAAVAAGVEMDWDDEEESTHVFEKRKHAMAQQAAAAGADPAATPRPAAGAKVGGSAAALVAGSGQQAAKVSTPPAAAPVPTASVPPPPPVPAQRLASDPNIGAQAMPGSTRRPSDEATVVRPRPSDSSGRAGVVLGGLALVAVGGLAAFLLWPRTGQLKIDVKSKDGQAIPRAEIFVDGQKRCDAAPCVVEKLAPGAKAIRVIPPGQAFVDAVETVEAGKEKLVYISLETGAGPAPTTGPATGSTGLKVASSQSGIKLFVDGVDKGPLPATVTDLSPGEHKIKLDGGERYASEERTVNVTSGELKDLGDVKLKVQKGIVALDLKTQGANVVLSGVVDGKKVEKKLPDSVWKNPPVRIPIDLRKEQWTLVATKKGLPDFRKDLDFADGDAEPTIAIELSEAAPAPIAATPTPAPGPGPAAPPGKDPGKKPPEKDPGKEQASGQGTLNINSIPVSKVLLDGRPIGSTPKLGVSVSAGTHSVTFIKDGERKSVSVTVKAGETKVASVKF